MSLRRETNTFELSKIKREIQRHGLKYRVVRQVLDEYNEDTGERIDISEIKGIFHIVKGYSTRKVSDGGIVETKGSPKLLVLFEDSKELRTGDIVSINGSDYAIREINNVDEMNLFCDLSLEVLQYGDRD